MTSSRTLLALLLILVATSASATTIRALSRAELFEGSDVVARVKVGARETHRSATSGRPLTHTKLTVLATLKGGKASEITLEQLGGTIGGRTLVVPGDARFETGEQAFVFMKCHDGLCHLYGLSLGKYLVSANTRGELFALGIGNGLTDSSGKKVEDVFIPLAAFESELRSYAK